MKKRVAKILIPFLMSLTFLTACQKAPEVSSDDEILRAKGPSEDAVEAIVNGEEEGSPGTTEEAAGVSDGTDETAGSGTKAVSKNTEAVSVVLGGGESRMKIDAEVAAVPDTVSTLIMQADSSLDEAALRDFLEPQGEVKDITEEVLAEEEAERQRVAKIDEKLGEGSSMVEIAGVGDGSRIALTDGNRKAILFGKTGGSYEDALLKEKCYASAKEEAQKLDIKDMEAGNPAFSLREAKELLVRKLSLLGIEDIHLSIAYICGQDGFLFYEMQFSPVVEGIPVANSSGQQDIARVYPEGVAWVCEKGVVNVEVWNCCMEQVSEVKNGKILSFSKVQELLETYLDDGSLRCVEDLPFSTAELVYYVELRDGKLELVPMWSIHMDLEKYVEYVGQSGRDDLVWNIYIDAVTGELAGAE